MSTSTDTLDLPDVRLHYELRGEGPLIALIGAPMDADAFAPFAEELATDHTVLTSDPRGAKRSVLRDRSVGSSPQQRAADLAALVEHVDRGPAIVFGSSGGAVTSLALAQSRPDLAATVIAHEPPLLELVPDRVEQRQLTDELTAAALSGDRVGAWRLFFRQANIPMPEEMLAQWFGGESDADEQFWFRYELPGSVRWEPDIDVLRSRAGSLILGIGEESVDQLCERTTTALGVQLDIEPTRFPGDHTGFVDHPAEFAARLRESLAALAGH
ncbi:MULTISPECIES: alpha/beta fold hydrolase [unclassified Microbacterium]|uniref:alpha/beta fold hydrolase n=1 Tax=unclassified Microbacterium TaxID=2609290 RepID=UPI001604AE47|nr:MULTISPECIES: alpha/beta hydrolase [unclassified Microbacterium]QNA91878.1 alpha/beta hydrolase [Microbacterium sp. Se63.02b]QYM65099.1 alpha/beta hydrolase [Microbacterium sp. Se5.02b]